MKVLAAVCLMAGLVITLINAHNHSITTASTTTAFLTHSSKPIKAIITATPNRSVLVIPPTAFQTITTASTKSNSAGGIPVVHQKSLDTLLATISKNRISNAVNSNRAENTAKRFSDKNLFGAGSENEDIPEEGGPEKDPGDEDGTGLYRGEGPSTPPRLRAHSPSRTFHPIPPRWTQPEDGPLSTGKTGGFMKTCAANWVVWGFNNVIWANCRGSGDRRGSLFWSRLGLDHMLGNDRGQLVYQRDGSFSSTCVDCGRWGKTHLACRCLNGRGEYRATSINLGEFYTP
ncbi:CVNH domain-containing protein [Colletotrichum tofieldiae]|nr:CVNH domain-containing protein [Colletotrichum tofieldiae]